MLFGFYPTNIWEDIFLILTNPGFWVYLGIVVFLVALERVITWATKRAVKQANLPKNAANSLLVAVRLIIVIVIVVAAFPFLGFLIPSELLVAITASLSTAIALFVSFSLSNVVAGVYLFFTRPFAVGDYVTIGNYEGIVEEISINYTTLYSPSKMFVTLPNQTVIHSSIINYRLKEGLHEGEYLKKIREEIAKKEKSSQIKEKRGIRRRLFERSELQQVASIFKNLKIYGYNFEVSVRLDDYVEGKTDLHFYKVANKWKKEFGYTPTFMLWKIDASSLIFRFIITVDEPNKIIEKRDNFIRDILEAIKSVKKS
ncbi:MAG: mechanosensitive ion channel [Candidatus Jordarchaeaceae archaeon]